MFKYLFSLLLMQLVGCIVLRAQVRDYVNEFLNIGAGAKGLAMGNAQVGIVNDATAGYWNPAGLMTVQDAPQFSIMHAEYFSGIGKYDFISAAVPVDNNQRVLGFTLLRFAVDNIPNTLYLVNPDGSVDYNNVTTFSSADYAFLFSYAQAISLKRKYKDPINIFAGGNVKIIHRIVGSFAHSWGFGIDAAMQADLKNWRIGIMAKDITTTFNAWQFTFTDEEKQVLFLTENDIPVRSTEITMPQVIPGFGYDFTINKNFGLLAEVDANINFDGRRNTLISGNQISIDPHAGLQATYKNIIFLRAGIDNIQHTLDDSDTTNQKTVLIYQPSIGAGFKIKNITIDYAFTNLANQSEPLYSNIFSLSIDLNKPEKK
jgi:hypothetical protein